MQDLGKRLYTALFKKCAKPLHLRLCTNDLYSDQTAESIVNTIIDHATSLKNDQHNTNTNTDNTNLNEKRSLVNNILAEICKEKNISY